MNHVFSDFPIYSTRCHWRCIEYLWWFCKKLIKIEFIYFLFWYYKRRTNENRRTFDRKRHTHTNARAKHVDDTIRLSYCVWRKYTDTRHTIDETKTQHTFLYQFSFRCREAETSRRQYVKLYCRYVIFGENVFFVDLKRVTFL